MTDQAPVTEPQPFHEGFSGSFDLTTAAAVEAAITGICTARPDLTVDTALATATSAAFAAGAQVIQATLAAYGVPMDEPGLILDLSSDVSGGLHHEGGVTQATGAMSDHVALPSTVPNPQPVQSPSEAQVGESGSETAVQTPEAASGAQSGQSGDPETPAAPV